MPSLKSLAAGTPDFDRWTKVTQALDGLAPGAQESAVTEFEAASAHWPATLDPWQGMNLDPGIELRRSPSHWVQEIYSGQHAPKHDVIRILESPRKPMRAQKLECLLDPAARLRHVAQWPSIRRRSPPISSRPSRAMGHGNSGAPCASGPAT